MACGHNRSPQGHRFRFLLALSGRFREGRRYGETRGETGSPRGRARVPSVAKWGRRDPLSLASKLLIHGSSEAAPRTYTSWYFARQTQDVGVIDSTLGFVLRGRDAASEPGPLRSRSQLEGLAG